MRILIIRTDRIGDMILTLPMATAIKRAKASHEVIMLAREYTEPLVKLCPDVDEIAIFDEKSSAFELAKQLRSLKADAVIIPSPKRKLAMAAMLSGIPIRIGTAYRWYSFCFNKKIYEHRKTAERNEAEYNLRMLAPLGIEADLSELPSLQKNQLPANPVSEKDYIVFHIPTGGSAPAWGADHWLDLAQKMQTEYQYPVILTGSSQEREFLLIMAERMKHEGVSVHILPEGSLLELAAVLQHAKLVIAGSTGPGHVAATLGAPTIGLFPLRRVLSKERWGFRGKQTVNLSPEQSLRPQCPECTNCECIDSISSEAVMKTARNLLQTR
jgi:heptosyltransferase-3